MKQFHQLTPGQEALWLANKLDPEAGAYNMTYLWEVTDLDLDTFRKVVETLSERISMWRSRFVERDGRTLVEVTGSGSPLRVEEIGDLEHSELDAFLKSLPFLPFNLKDEPPIRWAIFLSKGSPHFLMLQVHHASADVWSVMRALNELKATYQAYTTGQSPILEALVHQPDDFVVNQQKYLISDDGAGAQSFWKNKLNSLPDPLHLPLDYSRPPLLGYSCDYVQFPMLASNHGDFTEFAQNTGQSPFNVFLSVFQVFLARYCGQSDVLIGVPTAGRESEYADLFGYYVSPIVMRAHVERQSFQQFLETNSSIIGESLQHRMFPFPLIAQDLDIERDSSRPAVFQVQFVYENSNRFENRENPIVSLDADLTEVWDMSPMTWRRKMTVLTVSPFDITLKVVKVGHQFYGIIEYRSDLFKQSTIQAMADNYNTLLHNLIRYPEKSVYEVGLLHEDEQQRLLSTFNQTHRETPRQSLPALIEEVAKRYQDKVAVVYADGDGFLGRDLTYSSLNNKANQLGSFLRKNGVSRGDFVGVYMDRSLEMVISLVAILKAGATYIPLDPKFPGERLAYMVENAGAKTLLTQEHLVRNIFDHSASVLAVDSLWQDITKEPEEGLSSLPEPEDSACIIYTSGSTGHPKGVLLSHGNLVIS